MPPEEEGFVGRLARRVRFKRGEDGPPPDERAEAAPEPQREPESEPEDQTEPQPVVSERSARAILATATPPLPTETPKPSERVRIRARPEPSPPVPEPQPVSARPREWNLWELERAVRAADAVERQEEWTALFIHLREFANVEGDLPVEFDALVRESFASVLERQPEAATR